MREKASRSRHSTFHQPHCLLQRKAKIPRRARNDACQLQQGNKGFSFDASGTYKLDFDCDHSIAGNFQDAPKAYQETVLQKMFADAEASFVTDSTNYNSLKASCDAKARTSPGTVIAGLCRLGLED